MSEETEAEEQYCEDHKRTRLDKDGRCEDCDFAFNQDLNDQLYYGV